MEYPRPFPSATRDFPQCPHLNQMSMGLLNMLRFWSTSHSPCALESSSEIGAHILPTNVTGRQIAKVRTQKGLSQDGLAGKCQRAGWDISRGTLAKIEAGVRCVSDSELLLLAKALEVPVSDLFPRGRKQ